MCWCFGDSKMARCKRWICRGTGCPWKESENWVMHWKSICRCNNSTSRKHCLVTFVLIITNMLIHFTYIKTLIPTWSWYFMSNPESINRFCNETSNIRGGSTVHFIFYFSSKWSLRTYELYIMTLFIRLLRFCCLGVRKCMGTVK